ncbi:MAG: SCO family protein [Myxococcota bacterium]|nr:SCO family protein [Myxococcota bacterium]
MSPRALVLLCCLAGCQSTPPRSVKVEPPLAVPDFISGQGTARPFRLSEQRGKVVVVSFGYTSCPDICPTTLSRLLALKRALGTAAEEVETVFVSVDPSRDTAARLESYLGAFDPDFHPVRLEGIALARVLAGFGITARRNEVDPRRYANRPTGADGYSIDHTGGFFLLDPAGRLRFRIPHDAGVEALREAVASLLPSGPAAPHPLQVEASRAQLTPAGVGAIYLRLVNRASAPDVLLSARTVSADAVELHEVVPEGDLLRMVPRPEGFTVPGRSTLELAPGGKHLMLYGVREGPSVELELTFRHARPLRVQVPTVSLAGGAR